MKVSTVIVNYDSTDDIRRAVESLLATGAGLAHEVIVVDNHGRDGLAAMLKAEYPMVRLLEPGRNLWFTGGNNAGYQAAEGEYVYILNPDTVMQPGALPTMLAYLDAHPDVGGVTSRMIFPDGRVQRNCSRWAQYADLLLDYTFLGLALAPLRRARRAAMWYADWDRESDRVVEVAPGSNLLLRKALLDEIGLFDERLKLYFPEDDLCRRMGAAGSEVHYLASATIIHAEHASVRKVQRLATQVYFQDLIVYTEKWFGGGRARLLALLSWPTRAGMALAGELRVKR